MASSKAVPKEAPADAAARQNAQSELRRHEVTALLCCLLFPLMGALLLHGIRAQLSRPSEGLVSNFNLSVFLLASEIRPLAHLVRLVRKRTLYLQRVVKKHPASPVPSSTDRLPEDILQRIQSLESLSTTPTDNSQLQQKITTDVRLSVQPSLDALNRAVRRYEKRATLQSMQTEARLQELESRLQDALVLAAAAAKGSGVVAPVGYHPPNSASSFFWSFTTAPFRTVVWLASMPLKLLRSAAHTLQTLPFIGSTKRKQKAANGDNWEKKWEAARESDLTPIGKRVSLRGRPTRTTLGR
jgi:hypothetical protein